MNLGMCAYLGLKRWLHLATLHRKTFTALPFVVQNSACNPNYLQLYGLYPLTIYLEILGVVGRLESPAAIARTEDEEHECLGSFVIAWPPKP